MMWMDLESVLLMTKVFRLSMFGGQTMIRANEKSSSIWILFNNRLFVEDLSEVNRETTSTIQGV